MRGIVGWVTTIAVRFWRGLNSTFQILVATLGVLAGLAAVITFVLQFPGLWRDFTKTNSTVYVSPCREVFKENSNLKIIILPFFKTCETGRDVGLEIRNRLQLLKEKDSLNIDICYLGSFKQDFNFTKEKADKIRKSNYANQIIYGINSSLNCTPQDTLLEVCVNYLGDNFGSNVRPVSIKQVRASLSDIREGFLQANIDNIVYYFSAVSDYKKKRYKQAMNKISKLRDPNLNSTFFALKAELFAKLNNKDSALANYDNAIKYEPKAEFLLARAGMYRFDYSRYDDAIADCKMGIKSTKDSAYLSSFFFELAASLRSNEDYEESTKYIDLYFNYTKNLAEDKYATTAMYTLKGLNFEDLGESEKGEKFYDLALNIDPKSIIALQAKSNLLLSNSDYSKAIEVLNVLINNDPGRSRYIINRGKALAHIGETDLADKDFLTALKIDNYSVDIYKTLADIKNDLGKHWEALKILKYILINKPDSDIFFDLAYTYHELDLNVDALIYYNKVILSNPKSDGAIFNRSKIYFAIGNYKAAILGFSNYINLVPDDGMAYYWRGLSKLRINDLTGNSDMDKAASMNQIIAKDYKEQNANNKYYK